MPTVLVTGANRGLGLEFARQYAADGWNVIGTCRDGRTTTVEPWSSSVLGTTASEIVPTSGATADTSHATAGNEAPAFNPLPIALTLLQWTGIIGGSAATGGVGTIALWGAWQLLKRRRQRRAADSSARTNVATSAAAPSIAACEDAGEASPPVHFQ